MHGTARDTIRPKHREAERLGGLEMIPSFGQLKKPRPKSGLILCFVAIKSALCV
jgi:hypothetical protein